MSILIMNFGCNSVSKLIENDYKYLDGIWNLDHYQKCDMDSEPHVNPLTIEFGGYRMIYIQRKDSTKTEYATYSIRNHVSESGNKNKPYRLLILNHDIYNEVGGRYDTLFVEEISKDKIIFNQNILDTCFTFHYNKK